MRRALVYSKPYLHVCIYSTECYRVDFKESFRIFWYSVVTVLLQVLFQCCYKCCFSVFTVLFQCCYKVDVKESFRVFCNSVVREGVKKKTGKKRSG